MLKMKRFVSGLAVAAALTMPFTVFASGDGPGVTPDEALKKLMDGNKRFVEGKIAIENCGIERRQELTKGQNPFAIILGCSDSRVPPEHVFDQELGDIFIVRVAGNVADTIEIGSVEYAAEHLHVPLVVVMGHRSCGAVKATVAGGKPEGNIGAIVKKITPAVNSAKKRAKEGDALLNAAIDDNAKLTAKTLTDKSAILKHLVESGKLKIVAGVYDLASGKVEMLDLGEEKKEGKKEEKHEHKH